MTKANQAQISAIATDPKVLLEALKKLYPKVFSANKPKPLKIGIRQELDAIFHGAVPRRTLSNALGMWTSRLRYLEATGQSDSMRHDLQGNTVEPVSKEDRRHARKGRNAKYKANRKKTAAKQGTRP